MARFDARERTLTEAVAWRDKRTEELQATFDANEQARRRGEEFLTWNDDCDIRRELVFLRELSDDDAHRVLNARIQREHGRRIALWESIMEGRERYRDCSFDNFVATTPEQRAALDRVRKFAENLEQHIDTGVNVVLHGKVGTGKDHLLHALMRVVVMEFAKPIPIDFLAGYSLSASAKETRGKPLGVGRRILALSDPILPGESAKFFELQRLHELVDSQYSARLPVWASLNASTREEVDAMLSAPVADRLRHGAFVVFTDWLSHRKPGSF